MTDSDLNHSAVPDPAMMEPAIADHLQEESTSQMLAEALAKPNRSTSHWRRAARRFVRDPLPMAALTFLILLVGLALFAPLVTTHEPNHQILQDRFSGMSTDHWLGTDNLGRDTWSRLIYGARISLLITLSVGFFAVILAVPIGLLSGFYSGKFDVAIMRLTDAMLSVPPLVLALAIAGILGPGTRNLIIALTVMMVPGLVRLVRGQALAAREEMYIDASRSIGTPARVIVFRRVLPHVVSPLLVQVSIVLGTILVVEASLSYLGLGDPPPDPTWGNMLQDGFKQMANDARLILVPAIAIGLATLAFNVVGDGVRDALYGTGVARRRRSDILGTTGTMFGLKSIKPDLDVLERISDPDAETQTEAETADDGRVEKADVAARANGATRVHAQAASAPWSEPNDPATVLKIRDLSLEFETNNGMVEVLDKVNLEVRRGEILGLVGESGCGKTVTSQSILRLLPTPPARITGGEILFEGRDVLRMSAKELQSIRGREISMIFQDPMASLNPAYTIGNQIVEAQRIHRDVSKAAAETRAEELLDLVGIPDARDRLDDYPHMFSGGMRQRALIAMALANDPKLLIADEPTTALDVTVQAQIIELISRLREEFSMSVLFVTHDLGVVQDLCDRVAVMYAGQVVETASAAQVFTAPQHPYTSALLRSRPTIGAEIGHLPSIAGLVPTAANMPEGCRFHTRCDFATDACTATAVPILRIGSDQAVRCIRHGEIDLSQHPDERPDLEVARP
ncbi:MAG TPA: dipeptide/oligopeptide/nickel ABC transporter permease/ATP-binding protein [Acidimicrobiales bacterium]